ncbi:MAG: cellulose biosynthesis cyclic di-GMP-binding regulatory protein BcsB, partial [Gemmobacter sp.]|nr:cellulose biosynthesis cyclic di-GMP-binding regulatory protein BcsB [Gemmobacter sp.]
ALGGAPRIQVLPFYSLQTGREARARIALIASTQATTTVRRGAGGAFVLQIEHLNGVASELSTMLPQGSPEISVASLTPGLATSIVDLGAADILANTHYFRRDVDFLLPEDWLLLASQKAVFRIHYGFSADLAEGALLLFKVNGQTVRLLPLDREGGAVQPPLDISFRANRLNPGLNTLTFEMSVPGDPPDLACTPRNTDMLVVLGDSTLLVPPSPRMRQADMSRSLARLDGTDIVIPAEVADPARDADTLLAFGAVLRPLVSDGTTVQLRVISFEAAGLVPTGTTGVTRRMLQNAVFPKLEGSVPPPAQVSTTPATRSFSLADADGLAVPDQAVQPGGQPSIWRSVTRFFSPEGWLFRDVGGVRVLVLPGKISLTDWLQGKSGQAILLQLDPETPNDIWLIAGPDISMSDLAKHVDEFRRGGRGEAHGQAALLLPDGNWLTWSEQRRPELLERLTPQNVRAVLGNYASYSPRNFTILTLLLAILSVIPALLFVLITRRSGSRT